MSRDRTADFQGNGRGNVYGNGQNQGYNPYAQASYPQQQQYGQQQYGQQQYGQQQYGQQQYGQQQYGRPGGQEMELSALNTNMTSMNSFFDEISAIQDSLRTIQDNVARIEDLHARSLGTISEDQSERNNRQLDQITAETRQVANQVKNRIKTIEAMNAKLPSGSDANVRKAQAANLRKKFLEMVQSYQQVEYQNRQKYRQRMERQYRIVKPNATQEEINVALDNEEGGQIFAQSLMQSTRYGVAREALREVQERHDDIKKIEKTIEELATLFNEMSTLVEEQDVAIGSIEQHANQVTMDLETGVAHVDRAVESAVRARTKKWWCLLIGIILLAAAGGMVYFFVIKPNQK